MPDFLFSSGWHAYLAIFLVLYISGAGVPLPEELPLVMAGVLLAMDVVELVPMALCIFVALLLGDLTAYGLGRIFGEKLLRIRLFALVLTPARLEKARLKFSENERKAIFFGRFLLGLRLAIFIFAGMMRVPLTRFVTMDMLAASITATVPVVIGYILGDFYESIGLARQFNFAVGGTVVVAGAVYLWSLKRNHALPATKAAVGAPEASPTVESDKASGSPG